MNSSKRHRALLLSSALAGALALGANSASAQSTPPAPVYLFDIPAESLSKALKDFSVASSQQIVFSEKDIGDRKAPALHGRYTSDQALAVLLAGSDFHIATSPAGVLMVRPKNVQAASNEAAPNDQSIETVVVVGSNIRGVDNKTVPKLVISRSDIENSGYSTVQQVVASLPQNFSGGQNGASEVGIFGNGSSTQLNGTSATGINLRGLGTDSTLTLLDGHQLASSGFGTVVDVSLIPLSAIDHVEIDTDGASAVYGADAVAGVVNLVLRKDFDGAETDAHIGSVTSGGYLEDSLSQLVGQSWGSGNAMGVIQFRNQRALSAGDRAFTDTTPLPTDLLPDSHDVSLVVAGNQELGEQFDLSIDGFYTHKNTGRDFSGPDLSMRDLSKTSAFSIAGDVGYKPFGDWRVDLTGLLSQEDDTLSDIYFNYYGLPGLPGYVNGQPLDVLQDRLWSVGLKADGTLATLPGGDVRAAFGGSLRGEDFSADNRDSGTVSPFHRSTASAFAEVYVPIVSEQNSVALIRSLDVSIAGRYDHYSDFGSTTNPRFGVHWSPLAGLDFRGAYSTSFRAPNPYEEIANSQTTDVLSYPFAAPGGGTTPIFLLTGAGSALVPEKATNVTAGVDYQPDFLPGAKFSVNYYNIDYRDRIESPPFDLSALLHPDVYGSLITGFSTDAQAEAFLAQQIAKGATFFNYAGTNGPGVRYAFNIEEQNLAIVRQNGFDVLASYPFDLQENHFVAALNAAIINQIETAYTIASTPTNTVNTFGSPLGFRGRASITWSHQDLTVTSALNYSNAYSDTSSYPVGQVSSWTTVDLNVAYKLPEVTGLTISASVQNLFDTAPPRTGSNPDPGIYFDPANASPLGRFISVDFRERW